LQNRCHFGPMTSFSRPISLYESFAPQAPCCFPLLNYDGARHRLFPESLPVSFVEQFVLFRLRKLSSSGQLSLLILCNVNYEAYMSPLSGPLSLAYSSFATQQSSKLAVLPPVHRPREIPKNAALFINHFSHHRLPRPLPACEECV